MPKAKTRIARGVLDYKLPNAREEKVADKTCVRVDSALYNFSEDGGAVSTIDLGRQIPAGAVVTSVWLDCTTTATSGGSATVTVNCGSVALTTATAVASLTGTLAATLASSATAIKITTAGNIKAVVAVAALTAGVVRIYVQYMMPNDETN